MKVYYTGLPRKTCKYEDGSNVTAFSAQLYADSTFPSGIVFVRKRYEAMVYEKTCVAGVLRNTYDVKFLGRIGVMAQQYALSEQHSQLIDSLRSTNASKDQLIAQQETMIRRLEYDVSKLEGTCAKSDDAKSKYKERVVELERELADIKATVPLVEVPLYAIPHPPKRPLTEFQMKKNAARSFLGELNDLFSDEGTLVSDYFKSVKESKKAAKKQTDCSNLEIDTIIAETAGAAVKPQTEHDDLTIAAMIADLDSIIVAPLKVKSE